MKNHSTITLTKDTKKKLESLGVKGESFDEIVARVIENTHSLCRPNRQQPNTEDEGSKNEEL